MLLDRRRPTCPTLWPASTIPTLAAACGVRTLPGLDARRNRPVAVGVGGHRCCFDWPRDHRGGNQPASGGVQY